MSVRLIINMRLHKGILPDLGDVGSSDKTSFKGTVETNSFY